MIEEEDISQALESFADPRQASKRRRDIRPLRGIRGVPDGDVARIAAAVWNEDKPNLDTDLGALDRLFGAAFEDGMVAIGLAAAAVPDAPHAAFDLGLSWLTRIDDTLTADALGWTLLGPAALASGRPIETILQHAREAAHPTARRAAIVSALALLPEPLLGATAAPLRARLGSAQVQFVEHALSDGVRVLVDGSLRDEDPSVRKGVRRVLRVWAKADPAAVVAWADTVRGGLPKILKPEVDKARRRAERAP